MQVEDMCQLVVILYKSAYALWSPDSPTPSCQEILLLTRLEEVSDHDEKAYLASN